MRLATGIILATLSLPLSALELNGTAEFEQRLAINSSISARVAQLHVAPGQAVQAGDPLLSLVATGYQAQVDIARADVDAATPQVARMQTELDKARELYDRDSLAQVPLQQAEQDLAMALARLAAAEAKLELAEFRLGQTQIRSPIDGVVLAVDTFADQYINTRVENQALLTIAGNRNMSVTVRLPVEQDSSRLQGRTARITYLRQSFDGKVVHVAHQASIGANDHPALSVRILFATEGTLPAGLSVKVSIDD